MIYHSQRLSMIYHSINDIPLSKAINDISSQGQDGIPAEVFRCGVSQLLDNLHQLLCRCWEEESVPQEMRDSIITTMYKNKGDRSDRNNYRGI